MPELQSRWRGLTILVFAFPPVIIGLLDGQNATLSLLLYVLIYRSLVRGQDRAAGVWAALGLFKPQLFFVFPIIFLASRRWRALATYAATALTLALLSFALVGPEGTLGWLRILLDMETANSAANAWRMHSLKAFFDLLIPGQPPLSLALYALTSAALLAALAWVWSRVPFASQPRHLWALTSIVAVLVDPHLVDYDLAVLIPAAIFLAMLVPVPALDHRGHVPAVSVPHVTGSRRRRGPVDRHSPAVVGHRALSRAPDLREPKLRTQARSRPAPALARLGASPGTGVRAGGAVLR